jgi:general secretion pathway protein J
MRSPAPRALRQRGFTLLEILVAVAIFVVIGVLAMTGYNELTQQSARVETGAARVRAVQAAMMRMSQDFASLEPRPVREPLGETIDGALRADDRLKDELVELTHSGWSNPAGVPRPTLQRVAYRLQENQLRRDYWVVLDRTLNEQPISVVLLDKVKSVRLRYLSANRSWQEEWPPLGYSAPDAKTLRPVAVEIVMDLEDWGEIRRVIEVPG